MDFNEWFSKKDFKQGNTPCYVSKFAWDYQQNKIDQLEKDKQELIDCLKDIAKYTSPPMLDRSGGCFYKAKKSLEKLTGKSIEELLK